MQYEIEINVVSKITVTITAPSEQRALEIVSDRVDNEEIDLLDGDVSNWEINSINQIER
jgi:hypothetical protein